MPDYLIPADVIAAAAEAMEIEAIRCLGRDLGAVHRDDIAAAALGAALAAGLLAVPAAHQDQWVKQVDDPKELPGLLLRMADLLDALESLPASLRRGADIARSYNASPAAPADDAATVERVAVALWDTYTSRPANNVDHRYAAFWRVAACAALAALREGQ